MKLVFYIRITDLYLKYVYHRLKWMVLVVVHLCYRLSSEN